jgi:Phage integrase, N-terminal SAM-like domain
MIAIFLVCAQMPASQKLGAQHGQQLSSQNRSERNPGHAAEHGFMGPRSEGLCGPSPIFRCHNVLVVYRTREGVQRWQKLERYPIFTPNIARQEAIKVLRAKALGQDPAGEKMALRSGLTIAELCDEYSARDNGKKPGTIRSDNSRIKQHIKPKMGKLKVAAVTNDHVEDFMRSLSTGSESRVVGLLGAIFSYAVKRKLVTVNPCVGVEKPAPAKKTRRLSDDEYAQFGAALKGGVVSDILLLLAVTGWRSSEAKNLRWEELDLPRQLATLGDTKTGVSVRPLSGVAIDIIKRQKQNGAAYVFDHGHGKPSTHFAIIG